MSVCVQDVDAGDPRSVGVEVGGVGSSPISPDGRRLALLDKGRRVILVEVAGGRVTSVEGLPEQHIPVAWTADGKGLLVRRLDREKLATVRILRFDLTTRVLTPWREIIRPESASSINVLIAGPEDGTILMSYASELGELFVVDGLR